MVIWLGAQGREEISIVQNLKPACQNRISDLPQQLHWGLVGGILTPVHPESRQGGDTVGQWVEGDTWCWWQSTVNDEYIDRIASRPCPSVAKRTRPWLWKYIYSFRCVSGWVLIYDQGAFRQYTKRICYFLLGMLETMCYYYLLSLSIQREGIYKLKSENQMLQLWRNLFNLLLWCCGSTGYWCHLHNKSKEVIIISYLMHDILFVISF